MLRIRSKRDQQRALQEELETEVNEMEEFKLMEEKKKEAGETLVNKVAKLDAVLASELNDWKQDMGKWITALLQNITKLQNSQKLCEEQEKVAEPERESLMRDREKLEKRVAQLESALASKNEQREQEKKTIKERTVVLLQNITRLEDFINLLGEQDKIKALERESLLRDREQLQKCVDQLEATLASEREHQQQEKEKVEENTTALLQNINRFEASLNLLEEQEKTKALEIESLLRDREQLQKRVDQLEATLASEREHQQQEKEKVEENTTALLQNIIRFEASLNLLEEREKTKALETESLLRDREQLQKCVDQLEATLASEREHQQQEKEKVEENTTALLQNITRFEASLNLLEEQEKTKALEIESLLRDREQLQKRVDQLEATLASEREHQQQEKEKVEENTTALLQNIIRFEASLNLLEEREKTKALETESLLRDREQLQKCVDQLEATLASEREHQQQEKEKVEENTTALLQNITRFEASLNLLEEQEKTKALEIESLLRDREQLQKRVDQLEATLASEREHQQQEKEKVEENTTALLQNITRFEASLNLLEEQEKTKALEIESLLRDREQLQKRVDQLEATLASEREHQQQEKEKVEENTTALLQNIIRFEASLNLLEEREKTKALEIESLLRDREQLQKRVDQLEATLASERDQQNQEKEEKEKTNQDMEERSTPLLQNIIRFEASLNLLEEHEKTKALETESLLRDQEQLQKRVDQLEATLASEREHQEQEKEKKIEENTTALLQNITRFEAFLNVFEEHEKTKALDRESLRDREQLQKRVDQLEATLASEREHQEQEKEKKIEENTTALLQNITRFEAFLNVFEEHEKTKALERESLRDQEQLQKRVDQLEATLASEREHQEQEKEKKIEENTTALLQNITRFEAFLNVFEEHEKTKALERESLRDQEQLQKRVDQLEATLASEREHQEQEKEKKIEENTTALLQNIIRFEASLNLLEEQDQEHEEQDASNKNSSQ